MAGKMPMRESFVHGGYSSHVWWNRKATNCTYIIYIYIIWLVVWNIFIFSYIGNNHPNWLSYFSEGLKPSTRLYIYIYTKSLWSPKMQKSEPSSAGISLEVPATVLSSSFTEGLVWKQDNWSIIFPWTYGKVEVSPILGQTQWVLKLL